jgi:hypothetical protein
MIKTIYILWFQGFNNAPPIVKICVNSYKYYNPDWNIILLDNTNLINYVNLEDYIKDINSKNIKKCHLSDIIRVLLLKLYGGLWVDATSFCNKPLNNWLPKYITNGFFVFDKPWPDRLISNWFIYSDKNNYIIDKWCNQTIKYYNKNNEASNYFIHHYIFNSLYKYDIIFRQLWNNVPKLSANGPHYLQKIGYFNNITIKSKLEIDYKIVPVYKLTYKCKFPPYNINKNLYYLCSTINKFNFIN